MSEVYTADLPGTEQSAPVAVRDLFAMNTPSLEQLISRQISAESPPAVEELGVALRRRYGAAVEAILYYGSCLRQGDALEGVIDLYVVVDGYRSALASFWRPLVYLFLPPTVKYMEVPVGDAVARTKYALISGRDFRRGTSRRWFHSYLWGRFSQPCQLVYAKDPASKEFIAECLSSAVRTLISRTVPVLPERFDAQQLWREGLSLSYRSELRPESGSRGVELADSSAAYFRDITIAAAASTGIDVDQAGSLPLRHTSGPAARWWSRVCWRLRSLQGKFLSIARWLKALVTFDGGLDYAVWKLERHSGVRVTLSDRARRYPWIFLWGELWRLYRQGAFR